MRDRRLRIGAAVVGALLLVWLVYPSKYSRVENLHSHGTNIIAFGDSLTAGYGAAAGEDYPSRLSVIIGVPVLNAGVSGDTTEMALERLNNDVLSHDPRVVIIGLGGNDYLRSVPITTTEANLREIIRRIHNSGAMITLLGFRFPSLQVNYEDMYERVASDQHCLLIGNMLHGILTDPSLKSDEVHPNAKGYQLMAERVAGPLEKLLKKAGGVQPRRTALSFRVAAARE